MDPRIRSILLDRISTEWKRFGNYAAIDKAVIDYIDHDKHSDHQKMKNLLERVVLKNSTDFMSVIKNSLTLMHEADTLKAIEMFHASGQLKAYYLNTYATIYRQEQSQSNDLGLLLSTLKLASVEKEDLKMVNEDFNEWNYFRHKQDSYKPIKYDEVFDESSRLVLISGPKGIGKTNFLRCCLYHWAKGLHWKNFDFIFYFDFNKISKFQNVSNIKQLIKKFYNNILSGYEISSFTTTMFIMDGLDEFAYFEQLMNSKSSNNIPLITALEGIFSSESCKCVISGNIQTVMKYWGTVKNNKDAKNLQILGLNHNGAKGFLEDYSFSENLKTDLKKFWTSSRNGATMLSVPLYLKAVCSTLFTLSIPSVKTMTELQTLIFLHFAQQNCKESLQKTEKLQRIITRSKKSLQWMIQVNQQHILNVCEVAFFMFSRGKVIISQKEPCLDLDEKGYESFGLIKYYVQSQQYEFVHFFLLNFCVSVHLLFNGNSHEIITNERLRNCLPFISGFIHTNESSFLNLICQLKEPLHKQTIWLRDVYKLNDREIFVKCLREAQVPIAEELKKEIENRREWMNESDDLYALLQVSKQRYLTDKPAEAGIMVNRMEHLKDIKTKENSNCTKDSRTSVIFEVLKEEKKAFDVIDENFKRAKFLYDKQEIDCAERIFREVEKIQSKVLGKKHADTLTTKNWIARCLYDTQRFDDAEKMFRDVQNMRENVLGEKHTETLNTKHWIASCLYKKQLINSAEYMFRDIKKIRKNVLGERHAHTLNTKYWIARCLYDKQQFDNAEKRFRDVENVQTDVLGEKHAHTLNTKYWIARCLYDERQFDNAEKRFRDVENMQTEVLGEKHAHTLNTKYWIARCLYDEQQFDNAKKMFSDLEVMQKELLGEKHADLLSTRHFIELCKSKKNDCVIM